jgi:peptidyl-prolyl cis-trans isomerase A (cyclophilin A)
MESILFFGHVIEGQDVVDAVAQGDKLEALEIVREVKKPKWNAIEAFVGLKGASFKNKQLLRAEAKMETLAAGFEKTESGLRYQFIQRGDGKREAGKTVRLYTTKVH